MNEVVSTIARSPGLVSTLGLAPRSHSNLAAPMPPILPQPEQTLRRFAASLARQAMSEGWVVARETDSGSNREFLLVNGDRELHLFVKLSQSPRGFWGLAFDRAEEIVAGRREGLVLLTGPFEGYFLAPDRLRKLLPSFSRSVDHPEWKINENKVAKEPRFTTLIRLWQFLQPAIQGSDSGDPAPGTG